MSQLQIPKKILEQMIVQAKEAAPIEACGILAGRDGLAEKYYPMTNADNSSDHFTMEPSEQFAVVKAMRADGTEMLAVCHSHPETPARPSREDIRLAVTPGATYTILSLAVPDAPDIKAFQIEDGNVTKVPLEVIEE